MDAAAFARAVVRFGVALDVEELVADDELVSDLELDGLADPEEHAVAVLEIVQAKVRPRAALRTCVSRDARGTREEGLRIMAISRRLLIGRIGGIGALGAVLAACGGEAAPAAAPTRSDHAP